MANFPATIIVAPENAQSALKWNSSGVFRDSLQTVTPTLIPSSGQIWPNPIYGKS